jgi:HicB-like protein involved in pilus formation
MAENRTTDAVKLNLRLPKRLHRQFVQQATRRNVSLNTEIVEQLQGSEARSYKDLRNTLFEVFAKAMKDSPPPELFREWARQEITKDLTKDLFKVFTKSITKELEVKLGELLTKAVGDSARVAAETTAEILRKENRNLRPPG